MRKSLVNWLNASKRARTVVQEKIEKIEVTLEPNSFKVYSPIGSNETMLELKDKVLYVTVKMDQCDCTSGWGEKLDYLMVLNVRDEKFVNELNTKLFDLEFQLRQHMGKKIEIFVEWDSFSKSTKFRDMSDFVKRQTIIGIANVLRRGLFSPGEG